MLLDKINSLQLYMDYHNKSVVCARELEDIGCGMYPCYYMDCGDYLKISTSVIALICDKQKLVINSKFNPPDYIANQKFNIRYLRFFLKKIGLKKLILPWYPNWETIDAEIKKLNPFQKISHEKIENKARFDFTIRDKQEVIKTTVKLLNQFIRQIEEKYPEYVHVVLTGGKDSQLINLVPKINNKNWTVFSAEPNYPLVHEWIKINNLPITEIERHDGKNEETIDDYTNKLLCGDLYSDPRHIRFLPALKKIALRYGGKCIFWVGTIADTIFSYKDNFHKGSRQEYFNLHLQRASSWQGNYHQTVKNYTGCPILSPFHSREIWEELFMHLDPKYLKKNDDLRKSIGEHLYGSEVKWIDDNPCPETYEYSFSIKNKIKPYYVNHIRNLLENNVKDFRPDQNK